MKLEKATFDFLRLVIFKLLREIEENLTNICYILQFIIYFRGGHCSYPTLPQKQRSNTNGLLFSLYVRYKIWAKLFSLSALHAYRHQGQF
jgi:hypothetical protein